MNINQRLILLREAKGLSVNEVAEATGIDASSLYKYEGKTKPLPARLRVLADYYNVSVNYLLHGQDAAPAPNISKTDALLEELLRKIDKFMDLQTNQIGKLIDMQSKNKGFPNGKVIPMYAQRQSEQLLHDVA